jgi:hypothetical protein
MRLFRACLGKSSFHFVSHLYIKANILPRQARDRHRENSKNERQTHGRSQRKTLSVFLQERALPGTTNELRIAAEIEFNAADDAVNAAQFRCLALKRERSKMHFVRGRLRALAKLQWLMDQVQKPPLPAPLILTMVVLPRQARDKHRKNFEKEIHVPTGQGPGARPERRAEEGLACGG